MIPRSAPRLPVASLAPALAALVGLPGSAFALDYQRGSDSFAGRFVPSNAPGHGFGDGCGSH